MKSLWKLIAVVLALSLFAAACGGSDSDDDDEGASSGDDSAEVSSGDEGSDDGGDDGGDEGDAGGSEEVDTGGPVRGGRLIYGIEADTANPWTHYASSNSISGRMVLRSVTDPLFAADTDGNLQPYLVESVEPNEDLTEWTMTIREGITFHDGTPLDGAAVKYNIDACRFSPLTGPAFLGLADVADDGQTVTMTYSAPEALGPKLLRTETCGLMFSPTWMATLANNPLNLPPFVTEEEQAALDLSGDPAAPVGLGAFVFDSYTPGNGNSFVATRNEDYWRGDGPNSLTGEGLPYLDEIEFVVAVDIQSRSNGLNSGQFDIIHTSNADEIAKFQGDDEVDLIASTDYGETGHLMLNVGGGENPTLAFVRGLDSLDMDPGDLNSGSPLLHLSCRKALAHALDRQRVADERGAGIVTPANGPFPPGSIGYLEDSGYPAFDVDAAVAEFETCKEEHGTLPVEVAFNTTNDAFNVETNELIASMWSEAFGDEIDVSIQPIEQGQYIGLALAGTFQVFSWRNHGGVDPAEQWYWWNSATASPIDPSVPELALNFGRFQDPEMDAAFTTIRQSGDQDERIAATEEVNRLFAQNVWNLWTTWTLWGIVSNQRVQGITDTTFPEGGNMAETISGKHHLTGIWCTDGDCQG